jgi:hypothetical protein
LTGQKIKRLTQPDVLYACQSGESEADADHVPSAFRAEAVQNRHLGVAASFVKLSNGIIYQWFPSVEEMLANDWVDSDYEPRPKVVEKSDYVEFGLGGPKR